ncbi:MAG: hypothetical protein IT237_05700 [Bacteroidia bacterium]|nr:hypothetical protein [Bacteroidia bacterium]
MSSPFNYELDEKKIKQELQNAEVLYHDDAWIKFESVLYTQQKKSTFQPKNVQFNLGISRSVIIPVIFILLIGGLSALLFSFIDFKKKESVNPEIPYTEVYTTPNVVAVSNTNTVTQDAINTAKDTLTIKDTLIPPVNPETHTPIVETKETPTTINTFSSQTPSNEKVLSSNTNMSVKKNKVPVTQQIKKKPKNEVVLPSISAPIDLNAEASKEPELDL